MKILVTGASGFVGRNLCERLKAIRDGKDHTHPELKIDAVLECTRQTSIDELQNFCSSADFIVHLAGVNRPKDEKEFRTENIGFTDELLNILKESGNACPVLLASSVQASLTGRYCGSAYGVSKLKCEELIQKYSVEKKVKVYIYRFPNIFGKWCRPDYNSVVATFCNNIARDLPIRVDNGNTVLELLYIDDLVEEILCALTGNVHRCAYSGTEVIPVETGEYCYVPCTYTVTLNEIVGWLRQFHDQPFSLFMPVQPEKSFQHKLYAAYLSYLPKEKIAFPLRTNADARGSFTELIKGADFGQISVNISKPGVTKGQHWHNTKWEFFIVVSGHGLIRERRIGSDEILEFEVSGEQLQAVHMLPGYTHSLINLSDTENLITVMWANENFDPGHPDTFFEKV